MSNYPDFDQYGYHVIKELGRNREAGRITYLATALNQNQKVVIKEFRFALADASWSGYKAYQREIEVLQQLDHSRIPRYLDSFETPQGFCLVQEYKNAPSLAERRSFTPEQIKQIAVSVLEILVYLQRRVPPIIHRDIKPENILVDKQLKAYLVDFGFARIRGGEMALSSVAAGTLGFMPPEEQFGRPLTEASDLYSLGAMLICLLTGTRSLDIGNLIDDNYRFDFKRLVPQLNPGFIAWLEKMVAPNVKQRFKNAATALNALKPMRVVGGTNGLESLARVVKDRRLQAVLGLTTFGIFTSWAGINSILYQTEVPQPEIVSQLEKHQLEKHQLEKQVRQVKQFKQCVKCNLQGADLRSADLEDADLRGADLRSANLWGADLWSTNLKDADLKDADLQYAKLRSAKLRSAYLRSANLWSADLKDADLRGANLRDANLGDANLRSADLSNADLKRADLEGANLGDADLRGANLTGANLMSANLMSASLRSAKLWRVNLTGADLTGAYLGDVNLDGDLSSAKLRDANLRSTNLSSAKLRDADLSNADLRSANLWSADLEGANLADANLESANLESANLESANLEGADMRGADLRDANLTAANLMSAKLWRVNLRGADLEGANLEGADLSNAIMPDGTKHP